MADPKEIKKLEKDCSALQAEARDIAEDIEKDGVEQDFVEALKAFANSLEEFEKTLSNLRKSTQ